MTYSILPLYCADGKCAFRIGSFSAHADLNSMSYFAKISVCLSFKVSKIFSMHYIYIYITISMKWIHISLPWTIPCNWTCSFSTVILRSLSPSCPQHRVFCSCFLAMELVHLLQFAASQQTPSSLQQPQHAAEESAMDSEANLVLQPLALLL